MVNSIVNVISIRNRYNLYNLDLAMCSKIEHRLDIGLVYFKLEVRWSFSVQTAGFSRCFKQPLWFFQVL